MIKLSELLRFTLNYGNQLLIPLPDEMEEVKKYLALEQIRFGSSLQVKFNTEETTLNRLVPPAIILTLAENAIKQGWPNSLEIAFCMSMPLWCLIY